MSGPCGAERRARGGNQLGFPVWASMDSATSHACSGNALPAASWSVAWLDEIMVR